MCYFICFICICCRSPQLHVSTFPCFRSWHVTCTSNNRQFKLQFHVVACLVRVFHRPPSVFTEKDQCCVWWTYTANFILLSVKYLFFTNFSWHSTCITAVPLLKDTLDLKDTLLEGTPNQGRKYLNVCDDTSNDRTVFGQKGVPIIEGGGAAVLRNT